MQNKRALVLLLLANIISGFAQGISMLSIPWYFTNVVKHEDLFAVFYILITALTIFWSLYSGTLIDKYSRKNVFLFLNVAGAIILLGTSCIGYFSENMPSALVLLVFCSTMLIYSLHYPCLYACSLFAFQFLFAPPM